MKTPTFARFCIFVSTQSSLPWFVSTQARPPCGQVEKAFEKEREKYTLPNLGTSKRYLTSGVWIGTLSRLFRRGGASGPLKAKEVNGIQDNSDCFMYYSVILWGVCRCFWSATRAWPRWRFSRGRRCRIVSWDVVILWAQLYFSKASKNTYIC